MLTQAQRQQLYHQLDLSEAAQRLVETIRGSPPARRVRGRGGNVCVRYPSRKMGMIIQAESHKNELAGVYEKEYDPQTLEYYDQPAAIDLEYRSRSDRRVTVKHTPDFFVLRSDSIGWEEWKTEPELVRLAEKMPNRYQRDEEGGWRCPPGEAYAQPLGLFYRVRSSAEIDWILQRNLRFLEDYLREDCPEVAPGVVRRVVELVGDRPGLSLSELLRRLGEGDTDGLYRMLATGQVYCHLDQVALAEPKRVLVYPDQTTAEAYAIISDNQAERVAGPDPLTIEVGVQLVWDNQPWLIANLGETQTWLQAQDGRLLQLANLTFEALVKRGEITIVADQADSTLCAPAQTILQAASPQDLQEANRRYQIIAPRLKGQPAEGSTAARTIRRWLARYRQAEQTWGNGYLGLIPLRSRRGNRQPQLAEEILILLEEVITAHYETLRQKSKLSVYGELVRRCEERQLDTPSYVTFCRHVKQRPRYEQISQRQGQRAAYPYEPFYYELSQTTPRHGDRPFEIGHIDHTQLDLELICSQTGRLLGRPWTTFLMDAFSRRLLALYLTFDPPSYRSCMMVIRESVRRHGRLPQTVVVDNGPEFGSIYFETLLARYECTKKSRPGGKPRFGSVCERLFGTANTTFLHNLLGSTQVMRDPRQVTRATNPRQHAQWTLEALYLRLAEWGYEIYDTLPHPALGQTPRECFGQGLAQSGLRSHRLIPYDQTFQIFTLPTTAKGVATVRPNVGVKVNYIYYWAEAFRDPQLEGTQVPIRYDPFDAGLVYAYVKRRWVQCISEYYATMRGHSERELRLAAAELRQRQRQHGRQFSLTARRLAVFLDSLESEELLAQQRLRDAATQAVWSGPAPSAQEADDLRAETMPEAQEREELTAIDPPVERTEYGDF